MKKLTAPLFLAALIAIGLFGVQTLAQQAPNTTTLSVAVSSPVAAGVNGAITAAGANTQILVASSANILVGYELYVDDEAMLVTAIPTSGALTVQRGYDGTNVGSHASGQVVYIGAISGTPGSPFQSVDPAIGTCTLTNEQFTFRINVVTGRSWFCTPTGWRSNLFPPLPTFSALGSGATAIALTAQQSGGTFLMDNAAGLNYKLPVPQVGLTYDFVATVTVTSNAHEVQTDSATTFIQGQAGYLTPLSQVVFFACNGTSNRAIKMAGSTTGGLLGTHLHAIAVSATKWQIDGTINASGTAVTACTDTP